MPVRVTLEARQVMPYAQLALIRSALIGAATTTWILAPEDDESSWQRALHVEWDEKNQLLRYARCIHRMPATEFDVPHLDAEIARVEQRIEQVQELASAGFSKSPNMTDAVIPAAAACAFPKMPEMATRAELLWRAVSGAAHSLVQVLIHGPEVEHRNPKDGMAEHILGSGIRTIAESFMAVFWFSVTGWRLLERHGGAKFAPAITMREGLSDPLGGAAERKA